MSAQWKLLSLDALGALRVRGRDAVPFLQGQLSADVASLSSARALLAGYHNPQGRVLALLRLIELAPGDVLAVLPRELVAVILRRLSGFVLRSKVELADDSDAWRIEGLIGPSAGVPAGVPPAIAAQLPQGSGQIVRAHGVLALRVGGQPPRWLVISAADAARSEPPAGLADLPSAPADLWRRLAIEAGEPEVHASTSGEFVAQMLNLDLLGAIAFDKGCYTGQEIIARAHYRGRVKRRVQRFRSAVPRLLAPGDAGELADGRSFRVVDAVRSEDGACEFLAVAAVASGASADEATAPSATLRLDATQLPLPYELPE